MPRDFLSDDNETYQPATMQKLPRDFLAEPEPEKESLGASALYAPFRVATDIGKAAYGAAQKIPDYYNSAQSQIPGILKLLSNYPGHAPANNARGLFELGQNIYDTGHAAMQGAAGLAEAGQNIFNTPHDLINYAANRLNLFPKDINNMVQMGRMPDSEQQINATFGSPQNPGEEGIRFAGRNALNLMGTGKLLSSATGALTRNKKFFSKEIMNTHDALENRASEGFKKVSDQFAKRNLPNVPVSPSDIEKLGEYFPKTKEATALINEAKTGNYNALRKIQSDLYKKAKDNLKSPLETERMRGSEMLEQRENINQNISDHLKNLGQHDLNNILNKARSDFSTLMRTYYHPKMNKAIVNMVDRETRKIPNNLINVLNENSKPMQALRDFHPGLESSLNTYQLKTNALNTLKKLGVPVGLGALGGYGAMKYYGEKKP